MQNASLRGRRCVEWPAVVDIPPANVHLPSKQQRPASGSTRPSCTSIIGGFVALVFLQFGFNRAHGYAAPAKHLSSSSRSLRDSRITGDPNPPTDAERTRAAAKARLTLLREEPRSAHQSIVCRTFRYASVSGLLEDAIEHDTQGLDCGEQSCVNGFLQLVEQTCSDGVPVAYTGLWVNEEAPSRVDLDVLGALAAWLQPPPYKRPPPASGVWASQLLELTRPQCWQTRSCVVLDFGCGDGEALRELGSHLHANSSQLHCIEVYELNDAAGQYVRHVLPDPKDETAYCEAAAALVAPLREASTGEGLALIFSSVTFHHLPTSRMRACVYALIAAALGARGAFVLREWDNPGDLQIWFDLVHSWHAALPETSLPTDPAALRLAPHTDYSSWRVYEQQANAAGLVFNESLQLAALKEDPSQMIDTWPARNFEAIFTLGSRAPTDVASAIRR